MHTPVCPGGSQKRALAVHIFLLASFGSVLAGTSFTDTDKPIEHQASSSNRVQVVTQLLDSLHNSDSVEAKLEAVRALGDMRAEESIPALLGNLDLETGPVVLVGENSLQKALPVSEALKKIGRPAVAFIVNELRTASDPMKCWQLVHILSSIEGADDASITIEELAKEKGISEATRDSLSMWVERLRPPHAGQSEGQSGLDPERRNGDTH